MAAGGAGATGGRSMIARMDVWPAVVAVAGTLGAAALTHWWDERNATMRWKREESARWKSARYAAYTRLVGLVTTSYLSAIAATGGPKLTKDDVAFIWETLAQAQVAESEITMLNPALSALASNLTSTAREASLQVDPATRTQEMMEAYGTALGQFLVAARADVLKSEP